MNTNPFVLFKQWFEEAQETEINDPDAIALASVDKTGMPSVRMVLLKGNLTEELCVSPIIPAVNPVNCWPLAKQPLFCTGNPCAARYG